MQRLSPPTSQSFGEIAGAIMKSADKCKVLVGQFGGWSRHWRRRLFDRLWFWTGRSNRAAEGSAILSEGVDELMRAMGDVWQIRLADVGRQAVGRDDTHHNGAARRGGNIAQATSLEIRPGVLRAIAAIGAKVETVALA